MISALRGGRGAHGLDVLGPVAAKAIDPPAETSAGGIPKADYDKWVKEVTSDDRGGPYGGFRVEWSPRNLGILDRLQGHEWAALRNALSGRRGAFELDVTGPPAVTAPPVVVRPDGTNGTNGTGEAEAEEDAPPPTGPPPPTTDAPTFDVPETPGEMHIWEGADWGPLTQQMQDIQDELRKSEAARLALDQAQRDAQLAQTQAGMQLQALGQLSEPGANFFSLFARSPRGAQIPLPPELGATLQGRQIPGFGTIGGDIVTVPNVPSQITDVFGDVVRNLTSESIRNLSPQGLQQLYALGTVGGVDPTAVWQEREAAIPRKSQIFGSRFL